MNIVREVIMSIVRKVDVENASLKIELSLKLNVKGEIYLLTLVNDIQYSKSFKALSVNA